ncbi:hypothetical protein AJ79_02247 [Helicocarpus griseus UAMH5409]|uniref:Uncharacterized protein n=1 Tax=Helicocarpus griseus UAMH5409 TaxID=1447875 RepID=A0A2B7Y3P7_9EURO|nr:hypothetical protein AJ79_02247 [Helicocarpus griseus UAMH5409]
MVCNLVLWAAALLMLATVLEASSMFEKTPFGLVATLGWSPRPTTPPEVVGGLSQRQELFDQGRNILPGSVCGMVENDPQDQLTCVADIANCVYYGSHAGCCRSSHFSQCTDIDTACVDHGKPCDSACQSDLRTMKCSSKSPYCATYHYPPFEGATTTVTLYGCRNKPGTTKSIYPMVNYYSSLLVPNYIPLDHAAIAKHMKPTTTKQAMGSTTSAVGALESTFDKLDPTKNTGLSGQHIAAIIVGVLVVVLVISALALWLISKKRKKTDLRRGVYGAPSTVSPRPSTIMVPMLGLSRQSSQDSVERRTTRSSANPESVR